MKKAVSIVLVLVLLVLSLASCCIPGANDDQDVDGGSNDAGNTDNGNTDNGDADDGEGEVIIPTSLKINSSDISEYTIIYAYNPDRDLYAKYSTLVTQDTEYDKQTAENLAALIKQHFGVTVPVKRDGEQIQGGKEIIIGSTDRGLVESVMNGFSSVKDYNVRETNGNIVICGASYGATWHAAEDFISDVLAQNSDTAKVGTGYKLAAKAKMLVVGCIGDSLTNGSASGSSSSITNTDTRRKIVSYPAVLQRLEWKDMVVYNYGQGSRTMTENFIWQDKEPGDHAWNKSIYYEPCMQNAANIDLALIMLGTNDANENRANLTGYAFGTSKYKNAFIQSCQNIVNDLRAKNPNMSVALLNCPEAPGHSFEMNMQLYIRTYQKAAAEKIGIPLLDMYSYTHENMTIADFPDNCHPSDAGYTKFAIGIDQLIKPIVDELLAK